MPEPEKTVQTFLLTDGMNSDDAAEMLLPTFSRKQINCRSYTFGSRGVVKNIKGNTKIAYDKPAGTNITIGAYSDETLNRIYFANYNSQGYHTWYILDELTDKISVLLQSITDTDGIDILRWSPDYRILDIHIEAHNLLYWVNYGLGKACKLNIRKALDKTATGYGSIVREEYINAYKLAPTYAPKPAYFTDITRNNNELFALMFKFMYRYIYDDGEASNYSDYSIVPKPVNQSYQGISAINTDNNGINVVINTGARTVVKIEIAVQINSLKPVTCAVIHKDELVLSDYSDYTFAFYNDGAYTATDPAKIIRPYSYLPDKPRCQSKVKNSIAYTGFKEGWPKVPIVAAVSLSFEDIFLPSEESNQLNDPSITITLTESHSKSAGTFSGHYIVTTNHFVIGTDVKAGNIFNVYASNGDSDHFSFSYTATLADNAVSVAAQIKSWLRSLFRGQPTPDGISNESTDISGNVSWDYTYLGRYNENATTWTGSVNPVSTVTLKDNSISINLIKDGCTRYYAVMYEDDDLRKSLGYSNDSLQIYTPFRTEPNVGDLQRAIHLISIYSQPPIRAKYWQLIRTPDNTGFIEILIQQVIVVQSTDQDSGVYLDLIVGSLYTFQKIHPNTILQYTSEKGDRIRLIKNENTGILYGYLEAEILSYSIDTEQIIDAEISTHAAGSTDHVTPSDGPKAYNVGKIIAIAGYERTIIGVSGGDYLLDYPLSIGNVPAAVATTVPSYTLIDRRGVIRIKNPPVTIFDFSTIEIYKPLKNSNDADYKIFQTCGQKYEISNYGTDQRAHRGNMQDQDGTSASTLISTPAVVKEIGGESYLRFREMPTNNQVVNAQVIIDHVRDPNYSDWYESNLNDLGLPIPQDNGLGEVNFPNRTRFSNITLQDTQINGLNDFDNLDREDFNDNNGDIMRTLAHSDRLYIFKEFKDCWSPLFKSIIVDNAGSQIVGTSKKLLNELQYFALEGGIGNNPESLIWNKNYIYHASVNLGVFIRIAGDGQDAISTIYNYDKDARELLTIAGKYNLPLIPGIDRATGEVLWSLPNYIPYLFDKDFEPQDWELFLGLVPNGTTFTITQQPAHSSASVVSGLFHITGTNTLGDDFLLYRAVYPDTTTGPIKKFCFTVVPAPASPQAFRIRSSTAYCVLTGSDNTGKQGWSVLEGYNISDGSLSGNIMPNIANISPQAIVPDGTTITYHQPSDVAPSGGANGDIWYNEPADQLYKKIAGTWTLLTDRSANGYYEVPQDNLTDCPLPVTNNMRVFGGYGMTVTKIIDNTCTGIPGTLATISVGPTAHLFVAYTAITAGSAKVTLTGSPTGLSVKLRLNVNGVIVDTLPIPSAGDYDVTFPAGVTDPTLIDFEIDLV